MTHSQATSGKTVLTATKRDGLRVLLRASASLLATPELSSVLPKIVDLAAELIEADAYAVWRSYDADTWRIVAARGLSPEYRSGVLHQNANTTATLPRDPVVIEDLRAHPYYTLRHQFYDSEGIRSMLVVPLLIRNDPAGTITFYWKRESPITAETVDYAAALANLAAAAIHTAELYDYQVQQRKRAHFLAEAGTVLASSLDYEETLNRVAQLAVPTIADWCSVRVLENGKLARTAVAHFDPQKLTLAEEFAREYPDDGRDDRGVGRVLATGQSELYPVITDDMLVKGARNARHLQILRSLGMSSVLIVPLTVHDRMLGALTLIAAESQRTFTQDDLRVAEDLARCAAVAVDNAQLHRKLRDSEAQFRTLIEQSPLSTVIFDSEGHPLEANDAFTRLFGTNLGDAPPGYTIFTDPQLAKAGVLDEVRRAFQGENVMLQALRYEAAAVSVSGKGNTFWADAVLYPVRNANGDISRVVGMHADVTARIIAEKARVQTEEALVRTEKLAAAGRLAATVAHEINNPLAAITNLVFLARKDPVLSSDAAGYLDAADEELHRVSHLVRQTLGFYRDDGAPEVKDLGVLVEEMLFLHRKKLHERGITVRQNLAPGTHAPVVMGGFKQVFSNILSNAIDACSANGEIAIELKRETDYVVLAVADNGSGITPENLPQIFEPFFTTKKDVGTGLGLWISKQIIERHGGTIEIESATVHQPSGTRVIVKLP